jgi:hypothetical protein
MRIIGEIPHAVYKITVLKMNEKITIQIEDRLVSQSFVFRDGSGIRDLATADQLLTFEFMQKVSTRFKSMNQDYITALEKINEEQLDDFDII